MNKKESLFLQELQYIRQLAQEVAKENPHLANFLSEGAGDPDIERVIQGFALLAARLRGKIEDEFPELTSGMLAGYDWEIMKLLSPSPIIQAIKQATASKEIYLHHGKVVHFFQANSCPEWLISARNVSFITGIAEEILDNTTKLYLIPELNQETEKDFSLAGERQNALFNQLSQQEKDKLFVENRSADLKGGFGFSNHSSYKYAGYIDQRLRELCEPDKITIYQDSQRQFKAKMDSYKMLIPDNVYYRNLYFLDMDKQLIKSLTVSQHFIYWAFGDTFFNWFFPFSPDEKKQLITVESVVPKYTKPYVSAQYISKDCLRYQFDAGMSPYQVPTYYGLDLDVKVDPQTGYFQEKLPFNGGGWCKWKINQASVAVGYTDSDI
nr:type VI secretion system baseplate subunit TssF [Photorhabdus antumapuensis]